MKTKMMLSILAAGAVALSLFAVSTGSQTTSMTPFEQLKSLAGKWQATEKSVSHAGTVVDSTIRVVSNGTAIEEVFQSGEAQQMVTLYSPDGDRLAMIHLCSIGNQPRMETSSLTAGTMKFDFSFTGATNLASPNDPHMDHMTMTIIDKDHFDETWLLRAGGQEQEHAVFHFVRKA